MSSERWQRKAAAYRAGWVERFGVEPLRENIILGLAVAEHETRCGDAWLGENNWGAVQERVLNAAEKIAIGFVAPHPSHVDTARTYLASHGLRTAGLHVDSSPGKGYYWVYFRVFDTEAKGASYFIKILAVDRPSCRVVLEEHPSAMALADAMYRSHYYEGFYKKSSHYERVDGKWREVPAETTTSWTGAELNVSAYGGALQSIARTIALGLVAPAAPVRPTLRRGSRGEDVKFVQRVVGVTVDGIFGPKTEAAVMHWQLSNHLTADGIVGRNTWAAMESP